LGAHGAGRVLGRGAAKRQLKDCQDILDSEMSEIKRTFDGVIVEGIVSNHAHIPADESRHVYKSLDEVVKVLEEENIAKLVHRLYPVANIKGA
jgi:RNA-splicing ligase RtcB